MLDIRHLQQYKQSDTAFFLGSGQSINEITHEMWNIILKHDIWTVNNWIYHPVIVPDFYHIEVKHYNYDLIQQRIKEKLIAYKDVKSIFPRGKTIKTKDGRANKLEQVVPDGMLKFDYSMVARDSKRTHSKFNADYQFDPSSLTKSYDMSITAIFELMYKMGYKRIITFGIDLFNSFYFWTGGNPEYGEVHHQTNKAHENKPPEQPHATHRIKDFLVDFDRRWMQKDRIGLYVGHTNTALWPDLTCFELENLR